MSEDLSDLFKNVKNMVDSGNIPDELKEMLGNLNTSNSSDNNTSSDLSSLLNSLSGNNTSKEDSSNDDSSSNASNNSDFNIDIQTLLKMKSIIEAMNKKDDPRANLLYSLKPYLRESRKSKLDQYVNLLNMTKIADILKKENDKND